VQMNDGVNVSTLDAVTARVFRTSEKLRVCALHLLHAIAYAHPPIFSAPYAPPLIFCVHVTCNQSNAFAFVCVVAVMVGCCFQATAKALCLPAQPVVVHQSSLLCCLMLRRR
jgi:hypothetical protein